MPRYTQDASEVERLFRTREELWTALQVSPRLKVVLTDGTEHEGYLEQINAGNNAATMQPPDSYYGAIVIQLSSGESSGSLDLLDVKSITPSTIAE